MPLCVPEPVPGSIRTLTGPVGVVPPLPVAFGCVLPPWVELGGFDVVGAVDWPGAGTVVGTGPRSSMAALSRQSQGSAACSACARERAFAASSADAAARSCSAPALSRSLMLCRRSIWFGAQPVMNDNGSAEPLSFMTGWAPNQIERLQSISDRLSAGALHDRAAASAELAANALSRAQALQAALPCDCLDKAAIDDLGPVPTTVPAPGQSTAPTTSNPPSSTQGGNTHPKATGSGGTTPTGPVSVRIDPGTGSGTQSGTSVNLPIQLPPLPIKLPAPTQSTPGGTSGSQTCSLSVLGICLIP